MSPATRHPVAKTKAARGDTGANPGFEATLKRLIMVKRVLRKYGYPPDKQEKATQTVLEQAELLSELWAA
ncbi:MAG: DUF3387 domain-containing protein [Acidobacteria bacterium]|nr:DUF3387 domain-containing protein [Acidobacteriota bacterium]